MRRLHWVIAFCAMLAVSAASRGDEPADTPPPIVNPEREGPCDYLLPACPDRGGAKCTVDVIVGLPTGFRFQRAVDDDRRWHLEGFVGLEFIFPIAGVGVRRRYEPLCGKHDALIVAPGIDGYAMYNIFHDGGFFLSGGVPVIGIAAADVDILWRHSFTERCESQLGLKIGAGAGYGVRWGVAPIVGVFSGFRW